MSDVSVLTQLGTYLLYILLPLLALYIGYLIITKAFKDLGFSAVEAIIIVFVSFLLGYGLLDKVVGFSFSNIFLFSSGNWAVGINTGGAIIPIILSIYLVIKNKIQLTRIGLGLLIVTVFAFLVTYPDPARGIISPFPLWLLPAFCASVVSIVLLWKNKRKAAPLAYISGTIGVLIGADFLHLWTLLQHDIQTTRNAVIGGANVFDMIFITGILAVIIDGILLYLEKKET